MDRNISFLPGNGHYREMYVVSGSETELIKHGAAVYNEKTGKLQWEDGTK